MAVMHPAFPPEDSRIETFLPMEPGQQALALIRCGEANFTFRAETPLGAKSKARKWLSTFWADRRDGKHKKQPKTKSPAGSTPDTASPAATAPSESLPSDGAPSSDEGVTA